MSNNNIQINYSKKTSCKTNTVSTYLIKMHILGKVSMLEKMHKTCGNLHANIKGESTKVRMKRISISHSESIILKQVSDHMAVFDISHKKMGDPVCYSVSFIQL